MKETASRIVMESAGSLTSSFSLLALGESESIFDSLPELTPALKEKFAFTEEKVIVTGHEETKNFFVEYSNNLERFMQDQNVEYVREALDRVAAANNIPAERLYLVVEAGDCSKLNLKAAIDQGLKVLKK